MCCVRRSWVGLKGLKDFKKGFNRRYSETVMKKTLKRNLKTEVHHCDDYDDDR